LHEIHHFVFGHLTDPRLHRVANPRAMETAMEISANEYVEEAQPPGFRWQEFARHGIAPGQSTLLRYRLLHEASQRGELELPPSSAFLDQHRLAPGAAGARGQAVGLGDRLDQSSSATEDVGWRMALGLPTPPDELARMREQLHAHLERFARGAEDDAPSDHRVARQETRTIHSVAGAALPWPAILQRVFRRHRRVQASYLRPARRFPSRLGEIPGRVRRPPAPKLLVGVDTSGSMPEETLGRVVEEVGRLAAHARLTLAECDAVLHRVYPLAAPPDELIGGGDTDFAPVFAEAARAAHRYEGVVYFTDGRGLVPAAPPPIPTLWVLVGDAEPPCAWGVVVRLR
ncbi:MAG: hypothetical protein KDC87_08820, partial [Planctomycetes bacterium]|nr:hypothetical protein [Planctomycetota bacterium]